MPVDTLEKTYFLSEFLSEPQSHLVQTQSGLEFQEKIHKTAGLVAQNFSWTRTFFTRPESKWAIFLLKISYSYSIEKHKTRRTCPVVWVYWPDAKITSPGPAYQWYFEPCSNHMVLLQTEPDNGFIISSCFMWFLSRCHTFKPTLQEPAVPPTNPTSVYAYIGTLPPQRSSSRLLWRLGPTHLFEDALTSATLCAIYLLGPTNVGSFQAPRTEGKHKRGCGATLIIPVPFWMFPLGTSTYPTSYPFGTPHFYRKINLDPLFPNPGKYTDIQNNV